MDRLVETLSLSYKYQVSEGDWEIDDCLKKSPKER